MQKPRLLLSQSCSQAPPKTSGLQTLFSIGYSFNKQLSSALLSSLSFNVSFPVLHSSPIQQSTSTSFLSLLSAALFLPISCLPPLSPFSHPFPPNSSLLHLNTSVSNLRHQLQTITPFYFKIWMLNAEANQNRVKQIWHYARNKDILFTLFWKEGLSPSLVHCLKGLPSLNKKHTFQKESV